MFAIHNNRFGIASITFAILLSTLLCTAYAADTVKAKYDKGFGTEDAAVRASHNQKKTAAFAANLLESAKLLKEDPEYQAFMFNKAYEMGMLFTDGVPVAVEAMDQLGKAQPALKNAADVNLLTAMQKQYQTATGKNRSTAALAYVDRALQIADSLAAEGKYKEAAAACTKAKDVLSLSAARHNDVAERLELFKEEQTAADRIAELKTKLKTTPHDFIAAAELVQLLMLDKDAPDQALAYVDETKDARLKKIVPLAAKDVASLTEVDSLELGDWYRGQTTKARRLASYTAWCRAKLSYQHFLDSHSKLDADRLNATRALKDAEAALAKLPTIAVAKPLPRTDPDAFTNSLGMKFIRIKPGTFMMGSPVGEQGRSVPGGGGLRTDETQHSVTLTHAYYMGIYHVTRGDFRKFVEDDRYKTDREKVNDQNIWSHRFDQDDTHPVVQVTWNDAMAFADWLNRKEHRGEGHRYRLPTEAEWEYACRAGTTTRFYTGDDDHQLGQAAWYGGNSERKTHPVGLKQPNAFGLYDMYGNAWQWCYDVYAEYPSGPVTDPVGPVQDPNGRRVLRGASMLDVIALCRSAYRDSEPRNAGGGGIFGFRVVLDSPDAGGDLALANLPKISLASRAPAKPGDNAQPRNGTWVSLFNGKDLTGWKVDGGDASKWTVEQGVIVAHGQNFPTRNYILTEREFSDFILHLEFSLDAASGSGVTFRAVAGENMPGSGFDHPLIKLNDAKPSEPTGTTHWILDKMYVHPDRPAELRQTGSWNQMEVEVRGREMRVSINGNIILDTTLAEGMTFSDGTVPALNRIKGQIGLQKHTGMVRFRDIRILELQPKGPAGGNRSLPNDAIVSPPAASVPHAPMPSDPAVGGPIIAPADPAAYLQGLGIEKWVPFGAPAGNGYMLHKAIPQLEWPRLLLLLKESVGLAFQDGAGTDEAVTQIAKLQKLWVLELNRQPVTDASIAALRNHPALAQLNLQYTKVTGICASDLATIPNLAGISIFGTHWTGGLKPFMHCHHLLALSAGYTPIRDRDIADLAGHPTLENLNLGQTTVTSDCADALVSIPSLRNLWLAQSKFSDEGVVKLMALPNLEALSLPAGQMRSRAFSALPQFKSLRRLTLVGQPEQFTDADMTVIGKCTRLEILILPLGGVTDVGIMHLLNLKRLESIGLDGSAVTERGLAALLENLPQLKTVRVGGTSITQTSIDALKQKYPNVSVLK